MALAGRLLLFGLCLLLAQTLPVTARLLAATLLPPLACPISTSRTPPRPTPRGLSAGLAAVPCQRMKGRKPLLAPLQQTDPRTAVTRDLPSRRRIIMLNQDQGSCCSRRSSPGVELLTPLRDALLCLLLPPTLLLQLNHLAPFSPPILPESTPPGTLPPRSRSACPSPLAPQNWSPVKPPLTQRLASVERARFPVQWHQHTCAPSSS